MVGGLAADRFVLCEPFVLDCGNVATVGYKAWRDEIDERRIIVRRGPTTQSQPLVGTNWI